MKNLLIVLLIVLGLSSCDPYERHPSKYSGWVIVNNKGMGWSNEWELHKPNTDSIAYITVNVYFHKKYQVGDTLDFTK